MINQPTIRQGGAALLSVLWTISLLAVIASGVTAATRGSTRSIDAQLRETQARYAAEAGIELAVHGLLYDRTGAWQAAETTRRFEIGTARVEVTVHDEAGKIDLNLVQPELLAALLAAADLAEDERAALADAIMDWRDEDDLRRLNGAENAEYRAAGRPDGVKNGRFDSVAELQLVLGMTRELYEQLSPALTVHSMHAGVNPAVAPRLVLLALAGSNGEAVDGYIALREQNLASGLETRRPSFAQRRWVSSARGVTYTVSAAARIDAVEARCAATVTLQRGDLENPARVVQWTQDWRRSGG